MKERSLATLACVAIVAFGFWWFHKKTQSAILPAMAVSNAPDAAPANVPSSPALRQTGQTVNGPSASGPASSDVIQAYLQKVKADPQYDGKQPINFYGRVIDENNAALAGAKVHFAWNGMSPTGDSQADIVSDGNGFFSLTGQQGKYLYITVSKEGYYSAGNARGEGFEYANPANGLFTPDQSNPVVFQLRKKGGGTDLIHAVQLFGFHTNDTIQYLDLLQGKNSLSPPGDLAVQFSRGPRNSEAKYDWSLVISSPGGGVLESSDEFMFEAPTNDYQSAIEINETASDAQWMAGGKKRFYFVSRNGTIYGRAEATIYSHYQNGAAIDLDYYINPSGSRNLEPK